MTQDGGARVSPEDSTANTEASLCRQRKKRKWDQPAETLVSAGVLLPGVAPLGNVGALVGSSVPLPGVIPAVGGSILMNNPLVGSGSIVPPVAIQLPPAVTQISVKPKIQDELIIAREIVINDAEPSVRFKLTKRQTQEEIQKCTGAVVITRGKYRQPNSPPDGEKPLYLHISAAAHLKDTAERILAVDCAAAMVEEMLKQALSTCVFLGFDADPSLNIVARIHGPNDQYIKHIMNETGATVVLKGRGSGLSGSFEGPNGVEGQEALHLVLSAANSKSLEDAKRLAENLLDTIALECGASRVSSSNVYGAMPPPQTLLACPIPGYEHTASLDQSTGLTSSTVSTVAIPAAAGMVHGVSPVFSPGTVVQPLGLANSGQVQSNIIGYPQLLVRGGTSYCGYGGIYPQATPLQQVALALKQASSSVTPSAAITAPTACTAPKPLGNSCSEENRRAQRRKFQELPLSSNGPASTHKLQEMESLRPDGKPLTGMVATEKMTMPPPRTVQPDGMPPPPPRSMPPPPPPPPRSMPPPPPPPKFTSTQTKMHNKDNSLSNSESNLPVVSDTLFKLMEYGEEDDDSEDTGDEPVNGTSGAVAVQKPFWAI